MPRTLKQITLDELYKEFEDDPYEQRKRKKDGAPMFDRFGEPIMVRASGPKVIPPETKASLDKLLARDDVLGMVLFRCMMMDSSNLGRCTAVVFGPGCENKTLEELSAKRLGDVPSRFMDAESYYLKG